MKNLIIFNDPPYGMERSYNALRLAKWCKQKPEMDVVVNATV